MPDSSTQIRLLFKDLHKGKERMGAIASFDFDNFYKIQQIEKFWKSEKTHIYYIKDDRIL